MIASPSDVEAERQIIRDVIYEWNAAHSKATSLVLLPVGWETHSSPEMGDRPQEIISKQILRDCDLLVAVFGMRLGTDTGKAASGTVEEIEEHLNAGRPAMIYFSDVKVKKSSIDQTQLASLIEFQNDCMSKGLIEKYDSTNEFRQKFTQQLQIKVQEKLLPQASSPELLEEQQATQTGLSDDAKEVLLAAAEEDNKRILSILTMGGATFQAGNKTFCAEGTTREASRWESALNELLENKLVEECGDKGQVFKVTHLGYQFADNLRS